MEALFRNHGLWAALVAWTLAQTVKTLRHFWREKAFCKERILGAGGMPSAHTAAVTAFCVSSACTYGLDSFAFGISALVAAITIHDALTMRRELEKQGIVLQKTAAMAGIRLKTHLGHTPLQVLAGAAVGAAVGLCIH